MTVPVQSLTDATWAWLRLGSCAPAQSSVLDGFEIRVVRTSCADTGVAQSDRRWPSRMRRLVRSMLCAWHREVWNDSATLLVTELLTNALQHGRAAEVGLRLWLTATHLCIEVDDGTPSPTSRPSAVSVLDEHSRGLVLVAVIADDWRVSSCGTTLATATSGSF